MPVQTTTMRDTLAAAYAASAGFGAIYTTAPGGSAGTEPSGGGYVRKALSWGTSLSGVVSAMATFDVPAGTTINGGGLHATDGTYLDGGTITPGVPFTVQGNYQLNFVYTQA